MRMTLDMALGVTPSRPALDRGSLPLVLHPDTENKVELVEALDAPRSDFKVRGMPNVGGMLQAYPRYQQQHERDTSPATISQWVTVPACFHLLDRSNPMTAARITATQAIVVCHTFSQGIGAAACLRKWPMALPHALVRMPRRLRTTFDTRLALDPAHDQAYRHRRARKGRAGMRQGHGEGSHVPLQ